MNDTTVGLATFAPLLSALSPGHFYHNSTTPHTEVIKGMIAIPVYVTGARGG